MKWIFSLILLTLVVTPGVAQIPSVTIREWDVPTSNSRPHDPAIAPDGALWYTGQFANRLGRLDPLTGRIREYILPTADSGPHGLVADRDGNIWFTGNDRGYIGKLDPVTGNVTEYPMPNPQARDPHTPIFDQRGILWFTVQGGNFVGKLDPRTGTITLKASPTPNSLPYGIVVNSQGIPFYCEFGSNKIARIDPDTMAITEYLLPAGARPRRLAVTPDDLIYYADYPRGYLGRLDPKTGVTTEWRSPGGANAAPYGITSTRDGAVWYSESGVSPNTLIKFDPVTQTFEKWPVPSGGGVLRHIVSSPGGQIYIACSGVNKIGVALVSAAEARFSIGQGSTAAATTMGAANAAPTVGYASVQDTVGGSGPSGFGVFSVRQGGTMVSEASVPFTLPIRTGRVYAEMGGPVKTGIALANPNDQAANLSFFLTDSSGRDFNAGTAIIPARGQIARFLNEGPFNAPAVVDGTFTFSSDVPVAAIALRGFTNERSEFLITTLPVLELNTANTSDVLFAHFADGGGWRTEVLLVNPTDIALSGSVTFTSTGSISTTDYSIPSRSSRRVLAGGAGQNTRTGSVRVTPTTGPAPGGTLVFSFRRAGVTVSEAGVSAGRSGSAFRIYAENSPSIQTGIAVSNPSATTITVSAELVAAAGAPISASSFDVPANGQVALFANQINGLSVPRVFEGALRLSTAAPSSMVVAGFRGQYNDRGDFLLTFMPPLDESSQQSDASSILPHIVDGGGYSTQFVLFGSITGSSGSVLRFYNQSGQVLGLPIR